MISLRKHLSIWALPSQLEISFYALDDQFTPHTFRIIGFITHNSIQVLIDNGSTHNFIQQCLIEFLQFPITCIQPFTIVVGNGDRLECTAKCSQLSLILSIHTITIYLFFLSSKEHMSFLASIVIRLFCYELLFCYNVL